MSDWTDFCEMEGLDPCDPCDFDGWLDAQARSQIQAPPSTRGKRVKQNARELMLEMADANCHYCRRTGYRGQYAHVELGRCFRCIPDRLLRLVN